MPPTREDFKGALADTLGAAEADGRRFVDVEASALHRQVGGYLAPGGSHRMPMCCAVMRAAVGAGDEIFYEPPGGQGASLRIRFCLPRTMGPLFVERQERLAGPVTNTAKERGSAPDHSRDTESTAVPRVVLVSCVKKKGTAPSPARDLYVSQFFRGMRAYAQTHADKWYILSAEHGLVRPDQVIAPYDRSLRTMSMPERSAWAVRVQAELLRVLPARAEVVLLAGARYRQAIESFLTHRGYSVSIPMKGLGIGSQLKWLKAAARRDS